MYSKTTTIITLSLFFFLIFGVLTLPNVSDASKIEELREKIEERQSSIEEIEEKIKEYQQKLGQLGQQSATLETKISSLNTNVGRIQADIALTKEKIQSAQLKLRKIHLEIQKKIQQINKHRALLAKNIRLIDQRESTTFVEVLLKNDTISQFLQKINSLSQFQKGLGIEIQKLKKLKNAVENKEVDAKQKKQKLLAYQSNLFNQKKLLRNTKQEKVYLLKRTNNKESAYQKLLAQKRARKKSFTSQLNELESQLHIALNPDLLPEKGSQALSWPTKSRVITQHFGKTTASGRLYASGSHNGLDIGVPMGTPIYAATSGVVKGASNTDLVCPHASYGRFVFIKHNNGLATISAHLSSLVAHVGESVQRGQLLGYSGASGYVTGPHLHFGVYAKQAVQMAALHSSACPGAVYTIPIAPHNGYLAPLEYLK